MDASMPQYSTGHEQPPSTATGHLANGFSVTFTSSSHPPLPMPQPPPAPPPPPSLLAHTSGPSTTLTSSLLIEAPVKVDPELERELPQAQAELVPLSFLVERLASHAFAELANLAETLPHQDDASRKRAIVDYVLQTRRQLLKLLVLVRWSSEARSVAKCMDIVGFLARQNYELDHSVASLTDVKSMLAGARVRNYDIPTALSVLTTGTYTRLPSAIKDGFLGPDKLDDDVVLQTLADVDDVLRWRLACVERLPASMTRYQIHDGRATFKVHRLWEADFTYGGDSDSATDSWYLLRVKFLFRIRDSRGAWSDSPEGPMKEHIIELCNRELARKKPPEHVREMSEKKNVAAGQLTLLDQKHDHDESPFARGYNFLQNLVLSYQLESLYSQAQHLAATQYAGTMQIGLSSDRSTLTLRYWVSQRPDLPQQSSRSQSNLQTPTVAPNSSTLTFSIGALAADGRAIRSRHKALESLLTADPSNMDDGLQIAWDPDLSDGAELEDDIDLELLYKSIASEATQIGVELVEPDAGQANGVPSIHVHLHCQHYVIVSINSMTGHVEFKAVGEQTVTRESRLRSAADKVDRDRKSAADTLQRVRSSTILDEVESRAAYLGLQTSRRLPLRSIDLARFGTSSRSYLFIHLCPPLKPSASAPPIILPAVGSTTQQATVIPVGPSTNFFLTLVMTEIGFKFALVSMKEGSDQSQNWLAVEDVGWLDKQAILNEMQRILGAQDKATMVAALATAPRTYSFDVTLEDLRVLHLFCLRRIACFKVEQALSLRNIPFQSVASTFRTDDPTAGGSTGQGAPFLVIQSSDVSRDVHTVAHPNIAVQTFVTSETTRVTFHVKYKSLHLVPVPDAKQLPASVTCDTTTSIVTFSFDNPDEAVGLFVQAFAIIARSIVMARHRRGLEQQKQGDRKALANVKSLKASTK
ncbi:mediator complex subunit [Microbotryomycetes sp. JL221]|nr:mediator complex subunit [Microbotryomycetes sp. JL221]